MTLGSGPYERIRGPEGADAIRFIGDFAFGNRASDLAAYRAVYPRADIYMMDYVPGHDEQTPPGHYRAVHNTWKEVVDELGAPSSDTGQPTRDCR